MSVCFLRCLLFKIPSQRKPRISPFFRVVRVVRGRPLCPNSEEEIQPRKTRTTRKGVVVIFQDSAWSILPALVSFRLKSSLASAWIEPFKDSNYRKASADPRMPSAATGVRKREKLPNCRKCTGPSQFQLAGDLTNIERCSPWTSRGSALAARNTRKDFLWRSADLFIRVNKRPWLFLRPRLLLLIFINAGRSIRSEAGRAA